MSDQKSPRDGFLSRVRSLLQPSDTADVTPAEGEAGDGGAAKPAHSSVSNWIAGIGCLALAFVIWLFVMGTDSPGFVGDLTEIPIRIENNSPLSILSGDDLTVDLKVEGKRSVINKTDLSDIDVSITIDADAQPGRQSYELNIQLPGGLRLVESSLTKILIYLDNTTSVSVPIRVKISEYILEDRYELGLSEITTAIQSVKVTGPESLLTTIDCAQVSLSLGSVSRSVTCIGALTLVDRAGDPISSSYVRMAQNEVSVTIPVYKYRTVTPTVKFRHGYFNENNVSIKVEPASVTVKGEASVVDAFAWEYTIDEKNFPSDSTYQTSLDLPTGVVCVDEVESVSVSVTHIGTTTKTFTIANFRVENTRGHSYELITQSLRVRFRGDESLMQYLSASAITAVIDIGSYDASDGTISVPVTFRFSGAYAGQIWEVNEYSVTIRITS